MIATPQKPDSGESEGNSPAPSTRLFVREPGWRVALKVGSEKEYCYMTAPEQDHYHRLLDGEIYVFRADEKLCLPCAGRRGILDPNPRLLSAPAWVASIEPPADSEVIEEME